MNMMVNILWWVIESRWKGLDVVHIDTFYGSENVDDKPFGVASRNPPKTRYVHSACRQSRGVFVESLIHAGIAR